MIRSRAGGLAASPSISPSSPAPTLPTGYDRLRMTGSTAVDLCRVAHGSLVRVLPWGIHTAWLTAGGQARVLPAPWGPLGGATPGRTRELWE